MTRVLRGQPPQHARKLLLTPRKLDAMVRTIHEDGHRGRWQRWGKYVPTSSLSSPTLVLRDVEDRIVSDRNRRFNVATGIAIFTALLVEVPGNFIDPFIVRHQGRSTLNDPTLFPEDDVVMFSGLKTEGWSMERNRLLDSVRDTRIAGTPDVGPSTIRLDLGYGIFDITVSFVNNELYMHATTPFMDAIRTLPHVTFVLGMLHEHLARQIVVETGPLTLVTSELLVQTSDTPLYLDPSDVSRWPHKMHRMPRFSNFDLELYRDLVTRHLTLPSFDVVIKNKQWRTPQAAYLLDLARVMRSYLLRHHNHGQAAATLQEVRCQTLRYVGRPWLGFGPRTDDGTRMRIDATSYEAL